MVARQQRTIDSSFGVPAEFADAAADKPYHPARKVRTPLWRRIAALGVLGGITGAVGVALAIAVIGMAVLTLMLLERAIG